MKSDGKTNIDMNTSVKVMKRKDSLLIIALLLLCVAMMTWFFYGSIERVETMPGVFATEGDLIEVHQPYSGVLTSTEVRSGEYVTEGQVIAKVFPALKDEELPDLEYMLEHSEEVKSRVNGVVTNGIMSAWQYVDISTPIMCIEESENSYIDYVYCFVDNSLAETMKEEFLQNGKIDMNVRIQPDGYSSDVYGFIPGTIEYIFFNATEANVIKNSFRQLAENEKDISIIESGYPIMIHVDWSYLDEYNIQMGDRCNVQVIVSKKHPIDMIFNMNR